MKIAVLLFGHLRDFEQCADSLNENLLSRYDSDVFMHTWDEMDHTSKSWHESNRVSINKVDKSLIRKIETKYHPKGLEIEHQEKYSKERIIQSPYFEHFQLSSAIPYFIFYSLNKANRMRLEYEKKNGISYDYVFVTRPDIRLKTPFELEKYLWQIEVLGFNMDSCRFFATYDSKYFSLGYTVTNSSNDLFFFAKPKVIDKYIEVNRYLTDDEIEKYMINGVSIYTAKEIHCGLMPIPLTYMMDADWDYSGVRKSQPHKQRKRWKKVVYGIGSGLLSPIAWLFKRYRLFNYYEYKSTFGA